eukprot:TRINITY_DN386_c3_g1_i3.p1 TRINITY_DN386_c3_g1~~TRINITY_DN386_c3_g1_i3.p1  ORF type:complete len:178 (-),score=54.37 TRINITY_DN386_c3_g1_i3:218-751(-)
MSQIASRRVQQIMDVLQPHTSQSGVSGERKNEETAMSGGKKLKMRFGLNGNNKTTQKSKRKTENNSDNDSETIKITKDDRVLINILNGFVKELHNMYDTDSLDASSAGDQLVKLLDVVQDEMDHAGIQQDPQLVEFFKRAKEDLIAGQKLISSFQRNSFVYYLLASWMVELSKLMNR